MEGLGCGTSRGTTPRRGSASSRAKNKLDTLAGAHPGAPHHVRGPPALRANHTLDRFSGWGTTPFGERQFWGQSTRQTDA